MRSGAPASDAAAAAADAVASAGGLRRTPQGLKRSARSSAECCEHCVRDALCSVAVHVPAQGICWLKTESEAAGSRRPREGRTTLVPRTLGAAAAPIEVAATVPGDALTDLQRAGLLGDPLYENTFVTNASLWQLRWWRYSRRFVLDADADASLVLDGVKMGARVSLNGRRLGEVRDQFLRYTFALPAGLLRPPPAENAIEIAFDTRLATDGRFAACSGGWDWAPRTDAWAGEASLLVWDLAVGLPRCRRAGLRSHHPHRPARPLPGRGADGGRAARRRATRRLSCRRARARALRRRGMRRDALT